MNKKHEELSLSADTVRSNLEHIHIPRWEELPQIPLYMDQVIQYLSETLKPLHFDSDKPLITSSMVNNYVKTSLLKKPEKKQYKTYHLAFLVVVIAMKKAYSLTDILSCIHIYSDIEHPDRTARDYNKFVSILEACLQEVMTTGNLTQEYFEHPTPEQQLLSNVIRSLACKFYTQWRMMELSAKLSSSDPQDLKRTENC